LSARARHVSDWTWTYGPHVPTYLPLTVSCYVDLPTPPSFLAFTLDSLAPPVPLHPHDSHESPLPSSPFVPSWLRTPMLPINSPFHGYSPIFDTLYAVLLPDRRPHHLIFDLPFPYLTCLLSTSLLISPYDNF